MEHPDEPGDMAEVLETSNMQLAQHFDVIARKY